MVKSKCGMSGMCCRGLITVIHKSERLSRKLTSERAFEVWHEAGSKAYHEGEKYFTCPKLVNNMCSVHSTKPRECSEALSQDGLSKIV